MPTSSFRTEDERSISVFTQVSPDSGYLDDAGRVGEHDDSQDGIPGGCPPGGANATG